MFPLVMILFWWVDPEETTKFTQGAENAATTAAARLTRPLIEWSAGRTQAYSV